MNKTKIIYEFRVTKKARIRYGFDDFFFGTNGRVLFGDLTAARLFAAKINTKRDKTQQPDIAVSFSELNALGLIEEIFHIIIHDYRTNINNSLFANAIDWLEKQYTHEQIEKTFTLFLDEFPPTPVFNNEITAEAYLSGFQFDEKGDKIHNREIILEEMVLLWITNTNPAANAYKELFDDDILKKNTIYSGCIDSLQHFFSLQPGIGTEKVNLIELLRSPLLAYPESLTGQLEYIRTNWSTLSPSLISSILNSLDLFREENRIVFPPGPGPSLIPDFFKEFKNKTYSFQAEIEPEKFSPDLDWMPRLVLLAKNSYVWLDQLSKKYSRQITKLDDIPDEELDELSRFGITGLWLIGLWERSQASQKIKQLRGNPEAVASAYSIFSYDIAIDLGGLSAFDNLKQRAWKKGIRLSSDMVPNHMGIDSKWVVEHPDWFIHLQQSPFPSYKFNGPDLSWDKRVGIYIEDHYYDSTDAAVVFKRVDNWTGDVKYIYHGNDGTSMPWNDTAQLNYLIPEVREAVIQTILHVANQTPIIRFDAAMTLAKRHYHRLWFPEPGSGGDIPSRSGLGLSQEDFDKVFPNEFWREVVDRVALEQPDTLLLAEAFWLMEGYFVRTLGMHRVYNSAFMNMLRDEKNLEYRKVIKNTVEFDPEILKRYVNFMNNPDEKTAVDQFGKGDKYFGVCTMLATLPGLPMVGHGQIEGYTEKYGMEYRRAYWDENTDIYLVERHIKEIFPLFKKRYLFSEVENFLLYDFKLADGSIDEDVFAYSNRVSHEVGLIIYHNRYKYTKGNINLSVSYSDKSGEENNLTQKTLGVGLGIPDDPAMFIIYKDQRSGLEYLRNCAEIHQVGLFVELNAYQVIVFLNFRIVRDTLTQPFSQLARFLQGGGVVDMIEALTELKYSIILSPFKDIINPDFINKIISNRCSILGKPSQDLDGVLSEFEEKLNELFISISQWTFSSNFREDLTENSHKTMPLEPHDYYENLAKKTVKELEAILWLPSIAEKRKNSKKKKNQDIIDYFQNGYAGPNQIALGSPKVWSILISYIVCRSIQELVNTYGISVTESSWYKDLLFQKQVFKAILQMSENPWESRQASLLVGLLLLLKDWFAPDKSVDAQVLMLLKQIAKHDQFHEYLGFNKYEDKTWFRKESFEELVWFLFAIEISKTFSKDPKESEEQFLSAYQAVELILRAEMESEFQIEKLVNWDRKVETSRKL